MHSMHSNLQHPFIRSNFLRTSPFSGDPTAPLLLESSNPRPCPPLPSHTTLPKPTNTPVLSMIPFDHLSFSSDAVLCNVALDAVLRDSEELQGSPGAVVAVAGHVARRSYQLSRSLRVIGNLCLRRRHARDNIRVGPSGKGSPPSVSQSASVWLQPIPSGDFHGL